jgi:hypothetical protein
MLCKDTECHDQTRYHGDWDLTIVPSASDSSGNGQARLRYTVVFGLAGVRQSLGVLDLTAKPYSTMVEFACPDEI